MNENYPESDFPWNFYFHGEKMPRWTSTWSVIPVEWDDGWVGEFCQGISRKIDHVGIIESEDAALMILCVNKYLRAAIEKENEVRKRISSHFPADKQKESVYENIVDGLQRMLKIIAGKKVCLWTNGYPPDNDRLIAFINSKPDQFPHELHRQREIALQNGLEVKALRRIASTTSLPTPLRETILEQKP